MASKTKRQAELTELATTVALVLSGTTAQGYRPTLTDPAMAEAFDQAMKSANSPVRAWRGSKAEAR